MLLVSGSSLTRDAEFIGIIEDGAEIKEFDTDLYFRMIEKMTVFGDGKVVIGFLDGTEIECIIE